MSEPLSVMSMVVSSAVRKDAQCSSAAEMEPEISLQSTIRIVSVPEERMTSGHLVRADRLTSGHLVMTDQLKTLWAVFAETCNQAASGPASGQRPRYLCRLVLTQSCFLPHKNAHLYGAE